MKQIITNAAFAAALTLSVSPLYAGGNHDHGHDHGHSHSKTVVNEAKAKEVAMRQIKNFVQSGKLDKSWAGVAVHSVNKQTYNSMPEWIFTFKNDKEPNQERHSFYIFVNQYGEMAGANFTGK